MAKWYNSVLSCCEALLCPQDQSLWPAILQLLVCGLDAKRATCLGQQGPMTLQSLRPLCIPPGSLYNPVPESWLELFQSVNPYPTPGTIFRETVSIFTLKTEWAVTYPVIRIPIRSLFILYFWVASICARIHGVNFLV